MNELLSIRLSHLLRHCSVGAIVRGPDALMTVKDTRFWTDRNGKAAGRPLRYVERVRAALGIEQELHEPPVAKEIIHGKVEGVCIPAKRFPNWAKCPHCDLLHYLPVLGKNSKAHICQERDKNKCRQRPRLDQVPYILVHSDGHMDDLPWHHLAHSDAVSQKQFQCRNDTQEHYLRFSRDKQDQSKITLLCERCGVRTSFNPYYLKALIKFMRPQPWINESVELETPPEIMKVNHIQVHYPQTRNALVIPPESRIRKGTVLDRLYNSANKRRLIESCKTPLQRSNAIRRIASEFRCLDKDVESALKMIREGYPLYGEKLNITPGQLLEDEYKALIEEIPDVTDDEDFVTRHHTADWKKLVHHFDEKCTEGKLIRSIDRLIAVTRLKEIMVFEGFFRLGKDRIVVKPDITGENDWLPAVELFGEGLFVTIDQAALKEWESLPEVTKRAQQTQERYEAVYLPFPVELSEISPRFMLLHAISHLLIRQLECDCGYPAASLKERIYCSEGDLSMAGILIYVAVPDIVGSLGGIVEISEPRPFLALASNAIARSEWCSLDPVCSEQEGQGLYLLNRAACHFCLLVPEPSCNYQNTLLDRVFVKGDMQKGIPNFFRNFGSEER